MWLLEHESLKGTRIWLKPGEQYLYGRSSAKDRRRTDAAHVELESKTVSRKHMMLKVLAVQPGDGTKLHVRPGIEVSDISCKGTTIDGQTTLVSKKDSTEYVKTVLSGTQHTIRLSMSVPELRITWHPVVFTFASKDSREHTPKLHALGFKTANEFVHGHTTQVVSAKRNLPKVLQGLLSGKHIVTSTFLDSIMGVSQAQDTKPDTYRGSKLEEDYDRWWPKEKEYIPPAGKEPVQRPEELLQPDTRRSDMFSGLTFIFLTDHQFQSLQDVVSVGGGKALLFPLEFGETTIAEFVEFVRNTAGKKSRGRSSNDPLPVITIRPTFPDGMGDWATSFSIGVDQALNQRSIQQNELLDAIVMADISALRKPPSQVEIDSTMPAKETAESAAPDSGRVSQSVAASQAAESTPAPAEGPAKVIPRKRPMRRAVTQSRFTGFDDYEPPTKARKIEEKPMEDVQASAPTQSSLRATQSQAAVASTQASRRGGSPVVETVEELNEDELFPAAAALKKRRAATRAATASVEPEATAESQPSKSKGAQVLERLQKAKKKLTKEIDVREQTRLRVKEEEEKRKAEEESLTQALDGVDISEIRGLVQVENMEVKPRQPRQAQRNTGSGEGWDDAWNGRKNFKKFQKRGAERGPQPPKVIVALEEAPQKKGFGLGDAFFLEEPENPSGKAKPRRRRARAGRTGDSESEPEQGFTRSRRTQEPEVVNVEDSNEEEEEDAPGGSATTLTGRTQRVVETQLSGANTQSQRKRPPVAVAAGQPPSKRTKPSRAADDSDAEETGFRFRRRR